MNIRKIKAFTLVELIVTITILAILATIAIISYGSFVKDSRDSVRVADIDSLQKALELYKTKVGNYPLPDEPIPVTYSGNTVWTQGVIGESVTRKFDTITDIFVDPLTTGGYSYSVTNNKKEYQIGAILESNSVGYENTNILNETYAADKSMFAYVVGDYNGKVTKLKVSNITYIFATPSILSSDLSDPDFMNIIANNLLVYNGFQNISAGYEGKNITMTGSFTCDGNPLLFSGNKNNLNDYVELSNISQKFKAFYLMCDVKNQTPYIDLTASISGTPMISEIVKIIDININPELVVLPPNHAPTHAAISDISGDENIALTPVVLTEFSDADGDSLTHTVTGLPAGLSFDEATMTISGTPTTTGNSTLTYSANDGIDSASVSISLSITPDLRVWNVEHTLGCKRSGILSIDCKWKGLDVKLDDLETYQHRVAPEMSTGGTIYNCQSMTGTSVYTSDVYNSTFSIKNTEDSEIWCGKLSDSYTNHISLLYADSAGDRKSTDTNVDLDLGVIDITDNSYYTLHPYGFDYDFTDLGFDIDISYNFNILSDDSNTSPNYKECTIDIPAGTLTGSVTFENNEGCTSAFGINPNLTSIYLSKKDGAHLPITNVEEFTLPKFVIKNTDYTTTETGINFDFSGNSDFSSLIYGDNEVQLDIGGTNCIMTGSTIFSVGDGGACYRLFDGAGEWDSGSTKNVIIKYGGNSNFKYESESITITKP